MANDLTDAIVIALDHAGGNDECGLKTSELAGPTSQFASVRRAWQEVALLENLIPFIVGVSAESVEFHGLPSPIGIGLRGEISVAVNVTETGPSGGRP